MKLAITCAALAALLLAGCVKPAMDECYRGDRSKCPGEAAQPLPDRRG